VDDKYRYQPNMRFAESDRDAVAAKLRDAHADGRLTYQEFSERLDDLYQATTYSDLAPIMADLRQAGPARSLTTATASSRSAVRARRHGLLPILVICVAIWFVVVVGHGIVLPFIFWILVLLVVMRILRHRRRSSYR
jgi:Flp pilus assembly protein TadB